MAGHTYKLVEIAGSSEVSIEDAVRGAIEKSAETIRNLDWFEIVSTRGHIVDGKVAHFQVTLKVGFTLE